MAVKEEKGEAVCFTAGAQGAAFGAGVIHAWLASDRTEPRVVAGISMGSITAAAMQRSMIERQPPGVERTEASRWGWFQRYLEDVLDRPLDVIWKGLPDPVDFFSPTAPVKDLSCPEHLKPAERAARYQYWQLTKIGKWIAGLPLTIGELGRLAILKVRLDERIPAPVFGNTPLARFWRHITFYLQAFLIAVQILHNIVWKPLFTRTYAQWVYDEMCFSGQPAPREMSGDEELLLHTSGKVLRYLRLACRPLFGWKIWGSACLLAASPVVLFALLIWQRSLWFTGALLLAVAGLIVTAVMALRKKPLSSRLKEVAGRIDDDGLLQPETRKEALWHSALQAAGIDPGLVSDYQLRRRLWERFRYDNPETSLEITPQNGCASNLLVVASVLQSMPSGKYCDRGKIGNQQVWARPGSSLVDALTAACTLPKFFAPAHIAAGQTRQWLRDKDAKAFAGADGQPAQELDLIDGSVLRKNPLPALFKWLKEDENREVADSLVSGNISDRRIHVIYSVPIEPFDANNGKPAPDKIDLIEAAQVGLLMRARRDTYVEVIQTNFISSIQNAVRKAHGSSADRNGCAAYADEVAPQKEISFKNPLAPSRAESLASTAEGCRRTLSRLYSSDLEKLMKQGGKTSIPCVELIQLVASERAAAPFMPGLPEVCAQCTRQLKPYHQPPYVPALVKQDFIKDRKALLAELPNLCKPGPRIAFVASGGVFRGAFHIGLLGAMQTLGMKPDLVVGASVGTLMGGALATMRNLDRRGDQLHLLAQLSDTFLNVDKRVALTTCIKTAVKHLGLRSRQLKLSPAKLRTAVTAGTAADMGYAATGVPPLVIDTLSELFMIPPRETLKAASSFLAGKFADGFFQLASLVRKRTLDRLEILYAVIGASLLQEAARVLLGAQHAKFDLGRRQPYIDYQAGTGTSVFCTAAYVNQRWLLVLGRDALQPNIAKSFNFLQACLSSSAFPAAFEPRSEAEVFPGAGKENNLFCDGGTFDNLPFIPTLDLLRATQRAAIANPADPQVALAELKKRLQAPDLIISAGFDPAPTFDRRLRFESQSEVSARACSLSSSVKTDSFIAVSKMVAEELESLAKACQGNSFVDSDTAALLNKSVVAGIISVVPTSNVHVNPTFAFARSLGLERDRVAVSIADGCFQTLLNLRREGLEDPGSNLAVRSLDALGVSVELREGEPAYAGKECPFFKVACAFRQAADDRPSAPESAGCRQIYDRCGKDPAHQKLITIARQDKDLREEPLRQSAFAAAS